MIDEEKLKSIRDGFGEGLLEVARQDDSVVVLTADLEESTRVSGFASEFPNRFFEVGVAEQALVSIASGVANYGKTPVATSFGVFVPGRAVEQIRTTIAINNFPVVLVGSHGGFSAGYDGATHQALEDIAITRSLPNMNVLVPCDFWQAKKAIKLALKEKKPFYIRLERENTPLLTDENSDFVLGGSLFLKKSKDPLVGIIGFGSLLSEALLAHQLLESDGVESSVLNCYSVSPLDESAVLSLARQAGCLVVVEEHQKSGGLFSAVSEVLSSNFPVPIESVSVPGVFGESGSQSQLREKYGITALSIKEKALSVIQRKNNFTQHF
jgi:transketolase